MSNLLTTNTLPADLTELAADFSSFVRALLDLPPRYAAAALANRLLAEQQRGRAHLARALEWLGHYVETTPMPDTLRPQLRGELIRARIHGENGLGDAPAWPTYFAELLAKCQKNKHLADIAAELRKEYFYWQGRGLYAVEEFMERLVPYVLAELPAEMKASLETGVLPSLAHYLRDFKHAPETWPVWAVGWGQREMLLARRQELGQRLGRAESGEQAAADAKRVAGWRRECGPETAADFAHRKQQQLAADLVQLPATLDRLDSILAALDAAQAAGREEVRASELDGPAAPEAAELAAPPVAPSPTAGPFAPLLLNYTLGELTALLGELGLLDPTTGRPTPAASPGAWVGVIYALLEAKRPRLKDKKAAAQRAFVHVFGAVVSERAVHTGLGKRHSEAERFNNRALALLNK